MTVESRLYSLAGRGFANLYEIDYGLDPASLGFSHTALGGEPVFSDFVYFSVVSLATLGHVDVSPVRPNVRWTAVMEAVIGWLYIAVLVGRIVGLQIAAREREIER